MSQTTPIVTSTQPVTVVVPPSVTTPTSIDTRVGVGQPGVGAVRYQDLAAAMVDGDRAMLGQVVWVTGERRGGLFTVEDDGAQTDGVTCFPFDRWVSAEQTVTFSKSLIPNSPTSSYALPHQNIVFGSVKVYYDTTRPSLFFTDLEMNGHVLNPGSAAGVYPFIDHAAGVLRDRVGYFKAAIVQSTVTIRYRYATGARRLKRVYSDRLNLDWSGASGYMTGGTPGPDCRNELCWTLNAAKRLGVGAVYLPRRYSFYGSVEVPNGVTLRGDGVEVSGLRLMDDQGLRHFRLDFDATEPRWRMNGRYTVVIAESSAANLRVEGVHLDGNLSGNLQWKTDSAAYVSSATIENELQNTPVNNGLATTNHGGRVVPAGQVVRFHDVRSDNWLGSCILTSHECECRWTGTVWVGSSLRNHAVYAYGRVLIDRLVGSGYCNGTYFDLQRGWVGRLEYVGGAANPYFTSLIVCGTRDPLASGRPAEGLHIASFDFDLTGTTFTTAIGAVGSNLRFENGRVKPSAGVVHFFLFRPAHNGAQGGRHTGCALRNVTVEEQGTARTAVIARTTSSDHDWPFHDFTLDNVIVVPADEAAATYVGSTHLIQIAADRQTATWTDPLRVYVRNLVSRGLRSYAFSTDAMTSDTHGLEMHVEKFKVNNDSSNVPVVNFVNSQRVDTMVVPAAADRVRWYFRDGEMNVYATTTERLELLLRLGRFEGVRAMNLTADSSLQAGNTGMDNRPRRSEAAGTLTLTAAGGETSVLIALPLWWDCAHHRVWPGNATTAARGVSWVDRTNASGTAWPAWVSGTGSNRTQPWLRVYFTNPLQAGDAIVLHYDARVRGPHDPSPIG